MTDFKKYHEAIDREPAPDTEAPITDKIIIATLRTFAQEVRERAKEMRKASADFYPILGSVEVSISEAFEEILKERGIE